MADPGPEGLCYFHHDVLHTANWHGGTNINDFKNYLLLEVVVNISYDEVWEGKDIPEIPEEHIVRREKQVIPYANRRYVRYKDLYCMVGNHTKKMDRGYIVHGNGDGRNLSQWKQFKQVAFIPVPMPTATERFLWVDLTYPIRGIYLPSAHVAFPQEGYRNMARYAFLNFRRKKTVTLKTYELQHVSPDFFNPMSTLEQGFSRPKLPEGVSEPDMPDGVLSALEKTFRKFKESELKIEVDDTTGWGFQPHWTARFDIKRLEQVLHVPMDSRDKEFYDTYQFVKLFNASSVDTLETWQMSVVKEIEMGDDKYIKLGDVVSKHTGVQMEESKTEGDVDWMKEIVKNLITAGLGLIPYAGPFLSLGAETVADYLEDPEEWGAKNELKLGTEATAEAIQAGMEILKYYKKGKVPGIRFKAHLEEGDDRKPIYVGEDGKEGDKTPQPSSTKEKKTETKKPQAEINNIEGIPTADFLFGKAA